MSPSIKPHGVGVSPPEWALLANLIRATRWGPWRRENRRLHGAKERCVYIFSPSQTSLPCFSLCAVALKPLCWTPAHISVTRLGTWIRYKPSKLKLRHLLPPLGWEVSSTCAPGPVAAPWQGATGRLICSDVEINANTEKHESTSPAAEWWNWVYSRYHFDIFSGQVVLFSSERQELTETVAAHLLHWQVSVVRLLLTSLCVCLQQEASAFPGVLNPHGHLLLDEDFRSSLRGGVDLDRDIRL